MKMLTLFVLLCAGMVLTNAAAVPEAEPDLIMEEQEVEEASIQGEELLLNSTVPEVELREEMTQEEQILEVDGFVFSGHCPGGWTRYNDRCFLYIGAAQTWAVAERNCRGMGGNLAAVHSHAEERFVKGLIQRATSGSPETWIGGSDAQQEGLWLWTDSSHFAFTNWCRGEPNNASGQQHCLLMNFGDGKCWDDRQCWDRLPYVCARRL